MMHLQNFHEDDFITSGVCSNKSSMCDCIGHVLNGLCRCVMVCICKEMKKIINKKDEGRCLTKASPSLGAVLWSRLQRQIWPIGESWRNDAILVPAVERCSSPRPSTGWLGTPSKTGREAQESAEVTRAAVPSPGCLLRQVFQACTTKRRSRGRPRVCWRHYISRQAWGTMEFREAQLYSGFLRSFMTSVFMDIETQK